MKTRVINSVLLMAFVLVSTACNPVGFNEMKAVNPPSARSVDPIVPDVDPVLPPVVNGPLLTKGNCAADSSTRLLSCMNCLVPPAPLAPPQFSKKGEAFFEIMVAACQVRNGSDPAGYVPPTRAELMSRLNRLSPTFYPDSPMTPMQVATVDSLRTDPAALKKYFGGIFYSGVNEPTIAFETYFGLETREARYSFCYAHEGDTTVGEFGLMFTRTNSTPMMSKAYMDCSYRDGSACRELPAYINANIYRNQLRNAMTESILRPYVPVAPGAQQTCQWEKFEGLLGESANAQVKSWLANGFTIGGEIASRRMCVQIKAPIDELISLDSQVTLAAYRCK